MIGIGPGSYSFINERQIKVENNYKGFFQNTNFNKYTHISQPNENMRRLVFSLLYGTAMGSGAVHDELKKFYDAGYLDSITNKVVEEKKKEYKKILSLALGITEELEGYPYF